MASYRGVSSVVAFRQRFFDVSAATKRGERRAEPDLDLIKQVEQVATLVLEGPARRLRGFGA